MLLRPHEIIYGAALFLLLGKKGMWIIPALVVYDVWGYVDFTTDGNHLLAYVLTMRNLVYIVSVALMWWFSVSQPFTTREQL